MKVEDRCIRLSPSRFLRDLRMSSKLGDNPLVRARCRGIGVYRRVDRFMLAEGIETCFSLTKGCCPCVSDTICTSDWTSRYSAALELHHCCRRKRSPTLRNLCRSKTIAVNCTPSSIREESIRAGPQCIRKKSLPCRSEVLPREQLVVGASGRCRILREFYRRPSIACASHCINLVLRPTTLAMVLYTLQ